MSLTTPEVQKIGKLARIRLSDEEVERYRGEINSILKWVEQLQEVNTDDVPQLASVSEVSLPWREDKMTDGNRREQVLKNAPESDYDCFVVPKVIE